MNVGEMMDIINKELSIKEDLRIEIFRLLKKHESCFSSNSVKLNDYSDCTFFIELINLLKK